MYHLPTCFCASLQLAAEDAATPVSLPIDKALLLEVEHGSTLVYLNLIEDLLATQSYVCVVVLSFVPVTDPSLALVLDVAALQVCYREANQHTKADR